jgi:hypothetical protein
VTSDKAELDWIVGRERVAVAVGSRSVDD